MSLFREEVLRRKTENLHGTINLAQPTSWIVVAACLALILIVAGIFLSTASYSRTQTASGTIAPEGGILQITPPRAGRIESVDVTEGQAVRDGARLARIRVEETDGAGVGSQTSILTAIDTQDRRLQEQEALGREAWGAEQAGYAAQINGFRKELATLDTQLSVQKKLIDIARSDLRLATDIAGRGFISRRDIATREEALLARAQQLAALQQNRAAKVGALGQALQLRGQASARSSAAVAAVAGDRAAVEKERASTRADQGYTLVAPADGRVTALALHRGDSVTPQDIAMLIVPAGSKLVAKLYVPGKAAGFVRAGQDVRLAFEAYPYDHFGTVSGTITALSSAPILRSGVGGASTPFYVATATISDPYVRAYGRQEKLLPGMAFTARIVTEKRSLLEWLFDPLYAAVRS